MNPSSSLLNADPNLFSPVYLDTEKISMEQLLALYRFAELFFPEVGPGLVKTILDMEKHCEKISADATAQERRKLIREMKGLSMDIKYILKDEDEKLMEISVHIVPAEVLKRAQRSVKDSSPYQELGNNLDKLIVKLIIREIRKRFTFNLKDNFKSFLKSRQVPPFINQLLRMGWINRKGQLQEGASIEDLLTGKYSEQFEQLMPKEVMQEGMHIRETIRTCFEIGQDNDDSLIRNAKKRHALLEITIDETRRKV